MQRSRLTILLLLAVFLAAEPVVHTHPLVPDHTSGAGGLAGPDLCSICATGADSLTLPAPIVVAPVTVSYEVAVATIPVVSASGSRPLASRAPPAV